MALIKTESENRIKTCTLSGVEGGQLASMKNDDAALAFIFHRRASERGAEVG